MLRSNLLLTLVAFLAINYAQSGLTIPQTEEQVVVPQTLTEQPAFASADIPLETPAATQTKKQKRSKIYFPVDLIGTPLGCVPIDELEKLSNVSKWYANNNLMTYQNCWKQCFATRSSYAGLTKGNECLCSNSQLPLTTTFGVSTLNCTGNSNQKCGSDTCAEYFTLKKNSDILRLSTRLVDDSDRWLYKNGSSTWVRTHKGELEHIYSELLPLSSAIVTYFDCAAHPRAAAGCQNFYLIVTGFEDFVIKPNHVYPINVEWDITFGGQKSSYNEKDRLLVRRSLCEWIYKEDEEIKRELVYLNFEFDQRTLVLVDKRDPNTIIKVDDNALVEFNSGVENTLNSFYGKWFNKLSGRSFKDYFRGSYLCESKLTNQWYQPPVVPIQTVPDIAPAQTVLAGNVPTL